MDDITLSKSQKRVLLHLSRGKNLFLTGGAGTGKSFIVKHIIDTLEKQGKSVLICAPTGIAALNVEGITIHHAFGFPAKACINEHGMSLMTRTNRIIRNTDVIIVDEISMVRRDLFDSMVESIAKVEGEYNKKIQWVVVGDFYQLPPVLADSKERELLKSFYGNDLTPYAFNGINWNKLNFYTIELDECFRQKDQEFINNLNKLRIGDRSCIEYFNEYVYLIHEPDVLALCPTNQEVEDINNNILKTLPGSARTFDTIVRLENKMDILDESIRHAVPSSLHLKKGCRVMITSNEKKYNTTYINNNSQSIVNGAFGTIEDFKLDFYDMKVPFICVKLDSSGKSIKLKPQAVPIYDYKVINDKTVKFRIATYYQYPLKLAYAITIHKSQGQTYSSAIINPNTFASGQLYVALSRLESVYGLMLTEPINPSDIIVSHDVRAFYKNPNKKKMGRPTNAKNGSAKTAFIHVPCPLLKHIQKEIDNNRPYKLQTCPKYSPETKHIRCTPDLKPHLEEEIAKWKTEAKTKMMNKKPKEHK